ncbi:MAG: extracellular solute-binding protein [Rhodospirillales bacterium]|nr:extracellular solute-binding protein [Rhodospirillales bacterium]
MSASVLAAATVVFSTVAGINPASAEDWKAKWAKTIAAAEKEGIVVLNVQTNKNFRNYISKQWPIDFPKIKLSLTTQRTNQFLARIRTERKAGKYLWDGGYAGASAGLALYKEGAIDPLRDEFILPEVNDPKVWGGWANAFFDKPGKYVLSTQNYLKAPWYNADMIPRAKVEKYGIKLLLDPAYKGKIAWVEPLRSSSGQSISLVLYKSLGEAGLRKLIVDNKVTFFSSQNTMVDRMARKQFLISIGPNMIQQSARFRKAGVILNFRSLGNSPADAESSTGGGSIYAFNRRPHPNAFRVFANWVLNKKNAAGIAKETGNGSRRTDVAPVDPMERRPIPGATYTVTSHEKNKADLMAALAVIRKIRGK